MNAPNHGAHQRRQDKKPVFSAYFRYKTTVYYEQGLSETNPYKGKQRPPSAGGFKDDGTPPHGLHPATVFLLLKLISNILKKFPFSFCTVFLPHSKKNRLFTYTQQWLDALE